jgi:hypothetical protein
MHDPAPTQAGGLLRLLFIRLGSLPTDADQWVQWLQVLLRRAGPSASAAHSPKPAVDPASVFSVVICDSCRKRGLCEPALRLDAGQRCSTLNHDTGSLQKAINFARRCKYTRTIRYR